MTFVFIKEFQNYFINLPYRYTFRLTMGTVGDKIMQTCLRTGKLREVSKLSDNESNYKISNLQIFKKHPGFNGNKSAYYIPYNVEFQDRGWGCAWRAIQMVLTGYQMHDSFLQLFQIYSRKEKLMSVVRENKLYEEKVVAILCDSGFAPEDEANNWAQPFICKLVCEDKGIKSRLFLLNGYPYANSPEEVFQGIKSFKEFTVIVKESIHHSPVMIDDGFLAMSILAYREKSQNEHEFLIGDPHILSNRGNRDVGLYKIVCNSKGEQVNALYDEESLKQAYIKTLGCMHFCDKKWMVLATYGMK